MQRITPLFNKILLERLENKDAQTIEILSKYLAQIITQSSKNDASALSNALQSVISPAISKEIANNKETMIDALYPIMGGMISKYVTQAIKEMMESINKKIEQGLSFERVKRKAKAKLAGVSETELLLEESADARISALFVIHKETSLLIAQAHLENKEIDDAHMVASMASAIKDFINDWIKNSDEPNEVQLLSYGNATLYIESAGSVFIVAFLDAEPNYEQRKKINTFFASIVKKYTSLFQNFNGDDTHNDAVTLSMEMEDYLYNQEFIERKEKKNPAKIMFIIFGVLLFAYGAYLFNDWYSKYSLQKSILTQTGEHISIDERDAKLILEGQVGSIERIYEIEKIVNQYSTKPLINHLNVPMAYLDERFKSQKNAEKKSLFALENKLEAIEGVSENSIKILENKILQLEEKLKSSRDFFADTLQKSKEETEKLKAKEYALKNIIKIKNEIVQKLDRAFYHDEYYNAQEHALDFRSLDLFEAGKAVYDADAIKTVSEKFKKYFAILIEYKEFLEHIIIEGHSDSTGLEEENLALSKKRALSVMYYLQRMKITKKYHLQRYMKVDAYGSSKAVIVDGIEDKNASRRIVISFSLSDRKILNKLGKLADD